MTARVAVIVFPGSNCEHDVAAALASLGGAPELVWHQEHSLAGFDGAVLPGGFAHGDYLRPGAIARFSPVMSAVGDLARAGGPVVGICNGFQVLTEAGLLPGALQKNRGLTFVCTDVEVRVATDRSALTARIDPGTTLRIPVNHFEGNFTCDLRTLAQLKDEDRVILRYVANPNGSVDDIAGICNETRNVVGLMPHPERAIDPLTGSSDGSALLGAFLNTATGWRSTGARRATGAAGGGGSAQGVNPTATGWDAGAQTVRRGREIPALSRTAAGTPTSRHVL